MDIAKQNNVQRFDHWMAEIVKSRWVHNATSMCNARAIVTNHSITRLIKKINKNQILKK